ncbi:MAG: hypothetical protein J2P38_09310 [Candidatus Dormibacteraeota bacterium]|nr:hypothetical protein [Candidatus Dormibacteraeota bacterium]
MSLFSRRKPGAELERVRVALHRRTVEEAHVRLANGSGDGVNPVLLDRFATVAARAVEAVTLDDLNDLARHPDRLEARGKAMALGCTRELARDLEAAPPVSPSATGEQRHGPHWRQVSCFLVGIRSMTDGDWRTVIASALHIVPGRHGGARARKQALPVEADDVDEQASHRIGLGDQAALARADVDAAIWEASRRSTFGRACDALGVPVERARVAVAADAKRAVVALVVGSMRLSIPWYAALAYGRLRMDRGHVADDVTPIGPG